MSPEIILLGECDHKVDIWAAGCTLFEMLTGDLLFHPKKDNKGDRNFYHLYRISKLCGDFPLRFLKRTKEWRTYFHKNGNLKDAKVVRILWEDLLKDKKIPQEEIDDLVDVFKGMLRINPKKRLSVNEILSHRWFI